MMESQNYNDMQRNKNYNERNLLSLEDKIPTWQQTSRHVGKNAIQFVKGQPDYCESLAYLLSAMSADQIASSLFI